MARQITIEFEKGGRFVATLLDGNAPKTCESAWNALPIEGKVIHAAYAGELIFTFADFKVSVVENPKVMGLQPGDIAYNTHILPVQYPNGRLVPPELLFIYGPKVLPMGSCGWVPVNHFAKITEGDLKDLEKVGARVKEKGTEKVTLTRRE